MKILLLGGTGAMGVYLTEILSSKGNSVFVTTRNHHIDKQNVHYLKGNAHDFNFLNTVFHQNSFDAIVDFMVYTTEEFKERSKLLLHNTNHYIFLSSSRVYSDSETFISEETPRLLDVCKNEIYLATDEYALSKAREENILFESLSQNWTIIRPYITYGKERLQLGVLEKDYWLYQAINNRTIVFSEDIAQKETTLTYGYDVARCIAEIIGNVNAMGIAINPVSSENHKWIEIFKLYIKILEEELKRPVKYKMVKHSPNLELLNEKWQVIYDRLYNRKFDTSRMSKFISVSSFTPTFIGLEKCLREFIKKPVFSKLNWRYMAFYDNITGEWLPLNELPTYKSKIGYILKRKLFTRI